MNFSPIVKHREELAKINPLMAYSGGDFREWQKEAREKLNELLGVSNFVCCDLGFAILGKVEKDGYIEYEYKIESEKNFFISSKLLVPTSQNKSKLVISLYGDQVELDMALGAIESCDRDVCVSLVKKGYAVLALEMRNFDDCPAIKSTRVAPGEDIRPSWNQCYRATMRASILGRITVGERIFDIKRNIEAISMNFDMVDTTDITLIGNSGGATTAFYCAAIDERITRVVVSSGVAEWLDSVAKVAMCSCNFIPFIANYFNPGDIAALISPRKLDFIGYTGDTWFPYESLNSVYRRAESLFSVDGAGANVTLTKRDGDPIIKSSMLLEIL